MTAQSAGGGMRGGGLTFENGGVDDGRAQGLVGLHDAEKGLVSAWIRVSTSRCVEI